MTLRRSIAVLLLAVAACSSQPSVGSRFNGPTALVVFRGFTRKDASSIRDYIAVASSRGDEVRLLDPSDLQPVVSPGAVFPLSIPTAPRPLLLASAPLKDVDAAGNKLDLADVLVVASAGGAGLDSAGPVLQLIDTWDATNRVATEISLSGVLAAGSQILCLAGQPADLASGRKARILVGASPTQLVVVEFSRAADGSGAVIPGTPVLKPLTFDPVDIAVSPDGATVYMASRGSVGTDATTGAQVFGVAKLDASGDVVSATVTPLAAGPQDPDASTAQIGAPTIAVAAASNVLERVVNSDDTASADRFSTAATPNLVYAALDPDACGSGKHIHCGIVTIDPSSATDPTRGNLVVDPVDPAVAPNLIGDTGPAGPLGPASAQRYRAPIPVPGVPLHITVSGPPTSGSQLVTNDSTNPGVHLLTISPGTGDRHTGAIAMVSSSDGQVYWLDLSRFGPPSDNAETAGVAVSSVSPSATVDTSTQYQLGLWLDADDLPLGSTLAAGIVQVDDVGLPPAIEVWPGFTVADTWTIAYQGVLPSLSSRPGLLVTDGTGTTFATLQTSAGTVVTPIADPALGVRDASTVPGSSGDIVVLPSGCEARVAAVIPTSSSFPGGALRLDATTTAACTEIPGAGGSTPTTITVRASGLVFSSLNLGYLGRPEIARTAVPTENAFSVAWTGTADAATPSTASLTRLQQEQRAVERKARRRFYPSDGPCPIAGATAGSEAALSTGCYGTGRKHLKDPLAPGPMVRFRVGLVGPNPSDPNAFPPRDATISFITVSGLSQVFRRPVLGGAGAGNVIAFDFTARDPTGQPKTAQFGSHLNDPITLFVPYLDDQVITFNPQQSAAQVTSIR